MRSGTHPLPRGGTDLIASEAYFLFGNAPEDSLVISPTVCDRSQRTKALTVLTGINERLGLMVTSCMSSLAIKALLSVLLLPVVMGGVIFLAAGQLNHCELNLWVNQQAFVAALSMTRCVLFIRVLRTSSAWKG